MRRRNKIETQILELSIKKGTEAPGGKRKPKAGTGIEQQIRIFSKAKIFAFPFF